MAGEAAAGEAPAVAHAIPRHAPLHGALQARQRLGCQGIDAFGDGALRLRQAADVGKDRLVAERGDALAAETLPALQRSVKWGMAWYGVGDGWCFACGGFAGHVKLTFGRGTSLTPVPPVTPIGMGKDSRGVDLGSVEDLDERQLASWMRQAAAIPGFGKR